jgi:HPt (histidine-containing phosphotransfer) domain-containing protein
MTRVHIPRIAAAEAADVADRQARPAKRLHERAADLAHRKSPRAVDVIGKSRNPTKIAAAPRGPLRSVGDFGKAGDHFLERLRSDATALARSRATLSSDPASSVTLAELLTCVHKLAGAAGVFGLRTVSSLAAMVEESIIDQRAGRCTPETLGAHLNLLVDCLERELSPQP